MNIQKNISKINIHQIIRKFQIETEDELEIVNPDYSEFEGVEPIAIDVSQFNLAHEDIIFLIIKLRLEYVDNILVICIDENIRRKLEEKLKSEKIDYKLLQPNIREYEYKNTPEKEIKVFISSDMKSCKGREFDSVIIADLTKNKFEYSDDNVDNKDNIDKATSLYIAMTRARDELIFTYCEEPSNFLEYIKDKIIIIQNN